MEHIKQHIEERLQNFINRSYNSEDYKNAILDSIQFVGDIIRDKSGLDSDGTEWKYKNHFALQKSTGTS